MKLNINSVKKYSILIMLLLSGCATRLYNDYSVTPTTNMSPPPIIPGQTLYVYGDDYDVAAWKATGLFRDVLRTKYAYAPVSDSFYKVSCSDSYSERSSGMLAIASIIMFSVPPNARTWREHICTGELTQNGKRIDEYTSDSRIYTQVKYTTSSMESWGVGYLLMYPYAMNERNRIEQDNQSLANAIVISTLNRVPR